MLPRSDGFVTERIFRDAHDLHELMANSSVADDIRVPHSRITGHDIRLSTAVTMSARFPLISPHGNIRGLKGKIIDRVVDGGYFDNFGATTAAELADALEEIRLKPFIILINNEPTISGKCIRSDLGVNVTREVEHPRAPQASWFASLLSPFNALLATRQARATHAACSLIPDADRFAFITVSPDEGNPNKALSMSWWLSKHVQSYLDRQVDGPDWLKWVGWRRIKAARSLQVRIGH